MLVPNQIKASGIPTIDIAGLMQAILEQYENFAQWAKEEAMHRAEMEMESMLQSLTIDNDNNLAANVIARTSQQMVNNENMALLREKAPAFDICEVAAESAQAQRSACFSDEQASALRAAIEAIHNIDEESDDSFKRRSVTIGREFLDRSDEIDETLGLIGASVKTDYLTADENVTLTPEQKAAAEQVVQLVVGVYPDRKTSTSLSKETALGVRSRISDRRGLVYRNLVRDSMLAILQERIAEDGEASHLQMLMEFATSRFAGEGADEWLAKIANAHPQKTSSMENQTNGTQVVRSMAQMQAFLVYMEVLKYKQSLRMELLTAANLAIEQEQRKGK